MFIAPFLLASTSLAGWLIDVTDDTCIPFLVSGGVSALGCLGYIIMFIIVHRSSN